MLPQPLPPHYSDEEAEHTSMTLQLKPGQRYDMPAAFGPSLAPAVSQGFETFTTAITYTTTKDAIAQLLPHWYAPADQQRITVSYIQMVNMEWMGGRDYNIVNIQANVVSTTTPEPLQGPYPLAIWESDCAPIISGREYLGSPKLFAAIAEIDIFQPKFSFGCSEYGAPLLTASVSGMHPISGTDLAQFNEAAREALTFGWKYIPGIDGAADIDYPTAGVMSSSFTKGSRGQGTVSFAAPSPTEAPYSHRIVRALATIPMLEHVDTVSLHSSNTRLYRNRTRRLDV